MTLSVTSITAVPSQVKSTFLEYATVRYTVAGLVAIGIMKTFDYFLKLYRDSNPLNSFPDSIKEVLNKKGGWRKWTKDGAPTYNELDQLGCSVALGSTKGDPLLMIKVNSKDQHGKTALKVFTVMLFQGKFYPLEPNAKTLFPEPFDAAPVRARAIVESSTNGDNELYLEAYSNPGDAEKRETLLSLLKGEEVKMGETTLTLAPLKQLIGPA